MMAAHEQQLLSDSGTERTLDDVAEVYIPGPNRPGKLPYGVWDPASCILKLVCAHVSGNMPQRMPTHARG
jgi:hypothetical protein